MANKAVTVEVDLAEEAVEADLAAESVDTEYKVYKTDIVAVDIEKEDITETKGSNPKLTFPVSQNYQLRQYYI